MRIIICDDEVIFSKKLKETLRCQFNSYNVNCEINIVNDGNSLLQLCKSRKMDVVFLDIMMPGIDGYQTAEKLRAIRKDIMIVFISNNDSAFCRSYQYNPVWFVPKTQMQWITWAVKKIIEKYRECENEASCVTLKIENKNVEFDLQNIKYFKTDGHYIRYKCSDETESLSYRCKLSDIEEQLKMDWFVKVHNRYLVNLRAVRNISEKELLLNDGEIIPVSRNRKSEVKDKFQDYLRSVR